MGKPGDRPPWHGASAACSCRQVRSKADSANRSNCRPVFQSPLRTFHDGMSTFPMFQRYGVVDDNTRFHTPFWQSAPNKLLPHEKAPPSVAPCNERPSPDGNRDECCRKTTIGVSSALISNSMGDIAPSATSLAIPFSITTFDVSAIMYQNGFSPRRSVARSRQFLKVFNNATRNSDLLLHAAACRMARNTHCYGTCSRCEYVLTSGMIRVAGEDAL